MHHEITRAIEEIEAQSGNVISITFVEQWMAKYKRCFQTTSEFLQEVGAGVYNHLPPAERRLQIDAKEKFNNICFSLRELLDQYWYKPFCKQAVEEYHQIMGSNKEIEERLRIWAKKYERMGSQGLILFILDHLDYSEVKEKCYHLAVFRTEFFLFRYEFAEIIEFIEIFFPLYFHKGILPESDERTEKAIEEIGNGIRKPSVAQIRFHPHSYN